MDSFCKWQEWESGAHRLAYLNATHMRPLQPLRLAGAMKFVKVGMELVLLHWPKGQNKEAYENYTPLLLHCASHNNLHKKVVQFLESFIKN
jgi:hypothetical protein